jgi:hypothetical protein
VGAEPRAAQMPREECFFGCATLFGVCWSNVFGLPRPKPAVFLRVAVSLGICWRCSNSVVDHRSDVREPSQETEWRGCESPRCSDVTHANTVHSPLDSVRILFHPKIHHKCILTYISLTNVATPPTSLPCCFMWVTLGKP